MTDIHKTAERLRRLIEHIKRPSDSDYCNCESIAKNKWVRSGRPADKFKWNGKCVWDIQSENQIHIIKFYRQLTADKKSPVRIVKYLYSLRTLNEFLGKDFAQANKDDIVEVIAKIEEKLEDEWTKRDYKQCLKFFYRWLRKMNKEDGFPEEVRWITAKNPRSELTKDDLLTKEEVVGMVEKAENIRDKCFVFGLWDSGMRPEEYLSLKVSSVVFTDWGCLLKVPTSGKTGARDVPIVESAQYFMDWINVHPNKDDRKFPLWVTIKNKNNNGNIVEPISYSTASDMVKNLAELAGIKKRIYLKLFRHSGATRDSKIYKTPILKKKFGWSPSSKVPEQTYLHLDNDDVIQATLQIHEIETPENNGNEIKKGSTLVKCPRCQEINSISSKYCKKCWFWLDAREAWWGRKDYIDEKIKDAVESTYRNMFPEKFETLDDIKKDPDGWIGQTIEKKSAITFAKRKLTHIEPPPINFNSPEYRKIFPIERTKRR